MPTLSPTTLTKAEQLAILRITEKHPRDHTIFSLALGTGLRLGEIVGLNVGDVYNGNGHVGLWLLVIGFAAQGIGRLRSACH